MRQPTRSLDEELMEDSDPFEDASEDLAIDPVIEKETEIILTGGEVVKSYEGTSQYAQNGVSACGLASFNAVRSILQMETDGIRGSALIRAMLTRGLVEDAIGICAEWSSSAHLEVDDIYKFSLFSRALHHVGMDFQAATYDHLRGVLRRVESFTTPSQSAAVVITKSPEILAVFAISTQQPHPNPTTVFAVFDSHSREQHPHGAAFSFFGSAEQAARYLAKLMAVDPSLLNDPRLSWQVELLSQFSGHTFVAKEPPHSSRSVKTELELELLKANIGALELKTANDELKRAFSGNHSRTTQLQTENQRLKGEITRLRTELAQTRAIAENAEREKLGAWSQLRTRQGDVKGKGKGRVPVPPKGDYVGPGRVRHDRLLAQRLQQEEEAKHRLEQQQAMKNQKLKDVHLASELQKNLNNEDNITREEYFAIVKSAQKTFTCKICLEDLAEDELAKVDGCDHEFCRDCLRGFLESALDAMTYPIYCPVCKVEKKDDAEQGVVGHEVVEILGVSEKHFAKWIDLEMAKFSVLLDCPKCRQSVQVDKEDHAAAEILICPVSSCGNRWCKKCYQSVDNDKSKVHSCDGSKELDALIKDQGWKKCPGCQTPTERTFGCNHMTCGAPGCNTHFCYVDGALICQTQNSAAAKAAVDAHYQGQCTLFDVPAE